eukprot:scaffold56209_cov65-Cyclotella_meneghiniana.AAC.2
MVTKEKVYVEVTALERKFFELERNEVGNRRDKFHADYFPLRQMMVHPEASKKLREQINGKDEDQRGGEKAKKVAKKNKSVGRYSSVDSFARSSLAQAKARCNQVEQFMIPNAIRDVAGARSSLHVAMKVRQARSAPQMHNPFANQNDSTVESPRDMEAKAIRDYYQHNEVRFETLGSSNTPKIVIYDVERIVDYFQTDMKQRNMIRWGEEGEREALEVFIFTKQAAVTRNTKLIDTLNKEKTELQSRISALQSTVSVGKSLVKHEDDLASRHGSKSAALIRYLQGMQESEQTIVFSYWHDTLSLVHRSLKKCGISASFCDGDSRSMAKALLNFTTGESKVLLLSAQAKASGANLQCATTVILLDPAGQSAEHGAALENQAVGRAVRMGQANAVKIVRFCVKNSIEEELFLQIDNAALHLEKRSNDASYTCEYSHKSLVIEKDEATEEDPDDCCIGETLSAKEKLDRQYAKALENNNIICIDSDDEDSEMKSPSIAGVQVPKLSPGTVAVTAKRELNENTGFASEPVKRLKTATDDVNITITKTPVSSVASAKSLEYVKTIAETPVSSVANNAKSLEYVDETNSNAGELSVHDTSLGFSWKDQKWLEMFEQLKEVKEDTGLAYESGGRTALSKWCGKQRSYFKNKTMSAARMNALNGIDFPWTHQETYTKRIPKVHGSQEPLPMVTPSLKSNPKTAVTQPDDNNQKSDNVISPVAWI